MKDSIDILENEVAVALKEYSELLPKYEAAKASGAPIPDKWEDLARKLAELEERIKLAKMDAPDKTTNERLTFMQEIFARFELLKVFRAWLVKAPPDLPPEKVREFDEGWDAAVRLMEIDEKIEERKRTPCVTQGDLDSRDKAIAELNSEQRQVPTDLRPERVGAPERPLLREEVFAKAGTMSDLKKKALYLKSHDFNWPEIGRILDPNSTKLARSHGDYARRVAGVKK